MTCAQNQCRVGSLGSEDTQYETGMHICKHPPSIIRRLFLELCKEATEVFLVELGVKLKEEGEVFKENIALKKDSLLLAAAVGLDLDAHQSIGVILEQFLRWKR